MTKYLKALPRHDNGRPDLRYTCKREFIGLDRAQYVGRFCGDYIGYAADLDGCAALMREHQASRMRAWSL